MIQGVNLMEWGHGGNQGVGVETWQFTLGVQKGKYLVEYNSLPLKKMVCFNTKSALASVNHSVNLANPGEMPHT